MPYFFAAPPRLTDQERLCAKQISAFLKKKDLLAKTVEHFDQAHTHIDHQGIPMNHYPLPLIKELDSEVLSEIFDSFEDMIEKRNLNYLNYWNHKLKSCFLSHCSETSSYVIILRNRLTSK